MKAPKTETLCTDANEEYMGYIEEGVYTIQWKTLNFSAGILQLDVLVLVLIGGHRKM